MNKTKQIRLRLNYIKRLNKMNEIKDYFLVEIRERELISKYIGKVKY